MSLNEANDIHQNGYKSQNQSRTTSIPSDMYQNLVKSNLSIAQVIEINTYIEQLFGEIHNLEQTLAERERDMEELRQLYQASISRHDPPIIQLQAVAKHKDRKKQTEESQSSDEDMCGAGKARATQSPYRLPYRKPRLPQALDGYEVYFKARHPGVE